MSDSNVIKLPECQPKKAEFVFECKCGGQLVFLNEDGTVTCRSCNQLLHSLIWGFRE